MLPQFFELDLNDDQKVVVAEGDKLTNLYLAYTCVFKSITIALINNLYKRLSIFPLQFSYIVTQT
mgnify:CR=1 FL=1